MTRRLLSLFILATTTLTGLSASCGGSLTNGETGSSSSGASGNGSSSGSTGGTTNAASCPTVDYCALRCSGKETPLYPATCTMPTSCPCLVGVTGRSDWAGTYFLPDKPDATNLVIEADGTFHWTIDGCDFSGGDCGEWKKSQPQTIVLRPSGSLTQFQWNGGVGVSPRTELNVVGEPNGDLVIDIPSAGEKPSAQRWKKGRVCAICGGSGPTSQEPCTEPVEARCR